MVQIGCCCGLDRVEDAHVAGFDYVECTVVSLLPEQDEAAFAPVLAAWQDAPLPVAACNVFLPPDLKVMGSAVDWARVARYVEVALNRVQRLGAQVVVFGSGRARSLPAGYSRQVAVRQLTKFLQIVADAAEPRGLTIAIEPLNRQESNILNDVLEAVQLAQIVNRPSIRVLADLYHMQVEGEPLAHVSAASDWLAHVHVADSERLAPGNGSYPFQEFAAEVAAAGYSAGAWARVSVECRWQDFAAEAPAAVAFLRTVWPDAAVQSSSGPAKESSR